MRKMIVVLVLCSMVFGGIVPVFAQEETITPLPACTEEEMATTVEGLQTVDENFKSLMAEFDLSSDPNAADYGESLILLEAITAGVWGLLYPEVPMCAEAQTLVFTAGFVYDQALTIGLLANLGAWAEAAGDAEASEMIAGQVTARLEALDEVWSEMSEMTIAELAEALMGTSLPACTEEEMAAGMEYLAAGMDELMGLAEGAGEPVELFAVTEETSFTFWSEEYDELAVCAEGQTIAFMVGVLLNDANIIAGLYANGVVEGEAGNAEVAAAMTSAAQAREEMMMDMMMGE